jgi:hypothetical protein
MMLADPRFVITKAIEMIDEFQVALDTERRVFVDRMKRREKDSIAHLDGHGGPSAWMAMAHL